MAPASSISWKDLEIFCPTLRGFLPSFCELPEFLDKTKRSAIPECMYVCIIISSLNQPYGDA